MNTENKRTWRFLIVEDNPDIARQIGEICPRLVGEDEADFVSCNNFSNALNLLHSQRFDLIIVDLKEDSVGPPEPESLPGLFVFEQIKKHRFVPVVFYTALPNQVIDKETTFVRVVEKTDGLAKLSEVIREVFDTRLPLINRRIEETQRSYMWDIVSAHWAEYKTPHEKTDIAYLFARRLAQLLQNEARKIAAESTGNAVPMVGAKNIHPMQMYVYPSVNPHLQAGDLLKETADMKDTYWIVLTPSCDFEGRHPLDNVLLAKCLPISSLPEFASWEETPSNKDKLCSLICDRREKAQPERYKFLPGTFFMPDSLIDFQMLRTASLDDAKRLSKVASLDSPFAEAVLSRFSRYFGRLGTPDLDKDVVLDRLQAQKIPSSPPPTTTSPTS